MSERNPITKLWRDITGKTAREEQAAARQLLFKQQQQALLERAKIFRTQVVEALDIPKVAIPDIDIDYEKEAQELDGKVKARAIYAKIPGGKITFHSRSYNSDPDGWKTVGDPEANAEAYSARTPHLYPLTIFRNSVVSAQTYSIKHEGLRNKHFVAAVNVPQTEDTMISYMFNQGYRDRTGAYCPTVSVNFLMDKHSGYRVLGFIRLNPDFAEMFLQTAATGFEGGERYQGINRYQSDEVVIVNLGNFKGVRFTPFRAEGQRTVELASGNVVMNQGASIIKDMLDNKDGQIERYRYNQPYGKIKS
jgi:hypothetical protein